MRRLLVVLDLNGCLIDRLNIQEFKVARLNPHLPKIYHNVNKRKVFIRPHCDYFISSLISVPNVDVMVWTSAMVQNAHPICKLLFKEHMSNLKAVWHRTMCQPIPGTLHDTVKDLASLWSNQTFRSLYSPSSTVIIDDSMTKLHRHPDNAIIIPPYSVSDPKVQPSNDTALLSLLRYLKIASEKVNSEPSTDIREFMRSSPFSVIDSSSLGMRSAISTSSNAVPVENRSPEACRKSPSNHADPSNSIQPNVTVDRERCGYGRSKPTYINSNNDNDINYVIADGWRTFDDHDYEKSLELSTRRGERPVHRPKQKLRTKKPLVDSIEEITNKMSSVKVSFYASETQSSTVVSKPVVRKPAILSDV